MLSLHPAIIYKFGESIVLSITYCKIIKFIFMSHNLLLKISIKNGECLNFRQNGGENVGLHRNY